MRERAQLQRLLRPEEVADLLQVSRKTILRLIARGEMEFIAVGNRYRIPPEAVDAWLRRRGGRP
jgi:excisionase family DNA binding protein